MKEIWQNLKKWQKTIIVAIPLAIIVIVIVAVASLVGSEPKVRIEFDEKENIPTSELRNIREYLVGVIKSNTTDFDSSIVYVGKAREYNEQVDGNYTTATFIVDFDDIKESYQVEVTWPNPDDGSPNIIISCPIFDSKYPETPCTTESNSSREIMNFLPYVGKLSGGETYTVEGEYDDGELYLEVVVDSCGDEAILSAVLEAAKKWITSISLDPDDYLLYVPGDICSKDLILIEVPYIQANHAKTSDENVNKYLPYYIPDAFHVYPVVDSDNNVTSIRAEVPGCFEYQRQPGIEQVTSYLSTAGINYPVEFVECTGE